MTLRKGHGNGRGSPRIEVLPAPKLPAPVPATPAGNRRADGKLVAGPATTELARRGGEAARTRKARLAGLGLVVLAGDAAFAPYMRAASEFERVHRSELARIAGGTVSAGPSSMIGSAALQLAASRFVFDQAAVTGKPALFVQASKLADASRQNLLAAYELATREAELREQVSDDLAARQRAFQRKLREGGAP